MAKAHFVQLAHKFDDSRHNIARQFVSEKLDGMRAIWDGGISRGTPAYEVPYANCAKHNRLRNPVICTGLWSRYCQPIAAPKWFTDQLPNYPLDGELWIGRGQFQDTMSVCRTLEPNDSDWKKIRYAIFDRPSTARLFGDRELDEPQISLRIKGAYEWAVERGSSTPERPFADVLKSLSGLDGQVYWHPQVELPAEENKAKEFADQFAALIVKEGGEGVMVRFKWSVWTPIRSYDLLKIKPLQDMEGTVVGYTFGRRTVKGSKLLGKMGAAIIQLDNGKIFELSGFTDLERELQTLEGDREAAQRYASLNPEGVAPDWIEAVKFRRGTRISFKYRELTNDGLPKEARFFRIDPEKQPSSTR